MEAIYIPQLLKARDKTQEIPLQDFIPGLETLTPVRGRMRVKHGGTFLEVAVQAETIVTLTCDRCLQQYNHRLCLDTSEIIWLDNSANESKTFPAEREISFEDLSERLSPNGFFEPDTWLYEQFCLAMPLRQLCRADCQQLTPLASTSEPLIDSRWAALEALKNQLSP
jgi:uncharacterized protein